MVELDVDAARRGLVSLVVFLRAPTNGRESLARKAEAGTVSTHEQEGEYFIS